MSAAAIELPSASFAIDAPRDILVALEDFYPRSLVSSSSSRPAAHFTVVRDDDSWQLSRDGSVLGSFSSPQYALLALEYEIENLVIASSGAGVGLHAGGVVTGHGAWLIAGDPDTGKTSSTFLLLELDQEFLCEEIARYDPATRSVTPHPQTLALDNDFLHDYTNSFAVTSGRLVPLDDQFSRFIPRRMCDAAATVTRLILPRYRPDDAPRIEALSAESVLTEFLGYCFPPQNGEEALFDAVIDLLDHTQIYRVTYGDAGQARELYSDLLSAASAQEP